MVSKPIRSLLSSPLFFNTRSLFHSTEHIIYINIFDIKRQEPTLFTVYQKPDDFVLVQNPPIPYHPCHAGYAVVGPNIYVIGGCIGYSPSPQVWMLDCRFNRWQPGPTILVGRVYPVASVVDGKIYVIGGYGEGSRTMSVWAEVLDLALDRWEEEPWPCPSEVNKRCVQSAVVDDKIYVWNKEALLVYDPRNKVWESTECDFDLGWTGNACVVDDVVYAWVDFNIIKYLDLRKIRQGGVRNWKELKGLDKVFINNRHWNWWPDLATMANVGGNLLLVWISLKNEVWCAQVEVIKNGDAELWGKVCLSRKILSLPRSSKCYIEQCSAVVL